MRVASQVPVGFAFWAGFLGLLSVEAEKMGVAPALLAFAALVIVPLAIDLFSGDGEGGLPGKIMEWVRLLMLVPAGGLAGALLLPPGLVAALAAVPWFLFTAALAWVAVLRLRRDGWRRPFDGMCADSAMIYAAIGGAWVVADRAGWRPLNFAPEIVTLTAVHFHYAGIVLPLIAGRVQRELFFVRFASVVAVGVVLGVPAVALGITATQLGWGLALEKAAGGWLALSGMAVGVLHVRLAIDGRRVAMPTRALLMIAGVSLFLGMVLAGTYALRATAWLDIPRMRAIHGSLNAFGFAACGLIAWRRTR
ncbi:MAG: YndJ family transporter [Opitutaceae bacterium]|nr:YndJ family transporter [Opitutaceae bacterium]